MVNGCRLAVFSLALSLALPGLAQPAPSGLDPRSMDASVRPQDDLFLAVNGGWLNATPIPADKSDIGTFDILRDKSDAQVRAILEELASGKSLGGDDLKVARFYRAFMDEARIDEQGLRPLAPWFKQIDAMTSRRDLAVLMGRLHGVAGEPLAMRVVGDATDPRINRVYLFQNGLGLPDRDYYLLDDERYAKAREAYRQFLVALFNAGGDAEAARSAETVMALEKTLAQAQWSRVDNRDPVKTTNPMTVAELATQAPGFDWTAYFKAAALPALDRVIVSQPSYAKAAARAMGEVPLADWKLYLRARLLDHHTRVLPAPLREASFVYHQRALQGLQQDKPRWQLATAALNEALGEAVGRLYVQRHFPLAAKQRMQGLVDQLMAAYGESIDSLSWMGPETRARAKDKLSRYALKIGYPERWRDYTALQVREGDAFGNAVRAERFNWERLARRVGKPVDRLEWGMTPQTVNAYYNPRLNEIVFPAAILQPPFFDMAADDAVNYGAIGAVIGHEISHGFDDSGSHFDGLGALRNWWTEADRRAFSALADRLAAQYDAYEPIPGKHVNGRLTLGENIADLSGLQIAFKAYQRSLGGKPSPVIEGMTGEQRFFYGYARNWRRKSREASLLQLLTTNPHSPGQFRANGAAVNSDGFHDSFGTKPGDGMFKPVQERIRIW
jgi:putative endopeptidase